MFKLGLRVLELTSVEANLGDKQVFRERRDGALVFVNFKIQRKVKILQVLTPSFLFGVDYFFTFLKHRHCSPEGLDFFLADESPVK